MHPVEIDLSIRSLPLYTLYSLGRGLAAYGLSLAFTLVYGYWAAKDRLAERALIPMLDVFQSIPVLGFMPGLVLALVAIFPDSNVGLETEKKYKVRQEARREGRSNELNSETRTSNPAGQSRPAKA